MIKCPNCTGEMEFDVNAQEVKCSYCGSTFNPKDLINDVKMSDEKEEVKLDDTGKNVITGNSYRCTQCGAELMTFDDTAVTFCSYCGSQAMIESRMIKQNAPDYIIPFKKNKEECINNYKKKLNKSLFAPKFMQEENVVDKFRGIFMPYVIYKFSHHGKINCKGESYSHRQGDYIIYNQYNIHADVDAEYDGQSYDLISHYYDKFSHAIPYNFKEKEDFNPNYLVGFYADKSDVDKEAYKKEALSIAEEDLTTRLRNVRQFRTFGCSNPHVGLNLEEAKVGMFPVYFLAIRNKTNDKVNYAIVNGQTGEVAADIPVSFTKYVLVSLAIAIIIFLAINHFVVLQPKVTAAIAVACAAVAFIVSICQVEAINSSYSHENDIGYQTKVNEEKTDKKNKPKKVKEVRLFRYIYKEIIAIAIPLFALITRTVLDHVYYISAIVSIIIVIISFRDLIKEHNLLVSNKLPQLEKRGGDISE